jgi:hypothetical protein
MDTKQDQVYKILFSLGKGLWKSIPILGPIVEELFYEQFRKELTNRVINLTKEDFKKISELIPEGISLESIEENLDKLSENFFEFTKNQIQALQASTIETQKIMNGKIVEIHENTKDVPMFQEILNEVKTKIKDRESLEIVLDLMIQKRDTWINRISANQIKLLNNIPCSFTSINKLWKISNKILPTCVYKEFRFRLHEFEWLGLVERFWTNQTIPRTWMYKKTKLGEEKFKNE